MVTGPETLKSGSIESQGAEAKAQRCKRRAWPRQSAAQTESERRCLHLGLRCGVAANDFKGPWAGSSGGPNSLQGGARARGGTGPCGRTDPDFQVKLGVGDLDQGVRTVESWAGAVRLEGRPAATAGVWMLRP